MTLQAATAAAPLMKLRAITAARPLRLASRGGRTPVRRAPLRLDWLLRRLAPRPAAAWRLQVHLHLPSAGPRPTFWWRTTRTLVREALPTTAVPHLAEPPHAAPPAARPPALFHLRERTLQVVRHSRQVIEQRVLRTLAAAAPASRPVVCQRRVELVLRRETSAQAPATERPRPTSEIASVSAPWPRPHAAPPLAGAAELQLTPPLLNRITDQVVRSIDRRLLAYRERTGRI